MPYDAVICDWNGTIFADRDEKSILYFIGQDIFKTYIPFRPVRMLHMLQVKRQLDALYGEKRRDQNFDFVRAMFCLYNEHVLRGIPIETIKNAVHRYARRGQTQSKLDLRVLRAINACHQSGKCTGVLSGGFDFGIMSILQAAGFGNIFDFCHANSLKEKDGRAIGFELRVYRNKADWLCSILEKLQIHGDRVVYVGDSDVDEGCFRLVGYPVVSFMAHDEAKQAYRKEYDAFVPIGEKDLGRYLASL